MVIRDEEERWNGLYNEIEKKVKCEKRIVRRGRNVHNWLKFRASVVTVTSLTFVQGLIQGRF